METSIWVRQFRRDPKTGHITLRLQSETKEGAATWTGPAHDYGVDMHTFYGRFGGDIEQLKQFLVNEHKAKIGQDQSLTEQLMQLEGKQIG